MPMIYFFLCGKVALTALLRGGGWGEGRRLSCLGGEAGPLLQLFPGLPRLGVKGV